MEWEVEGIGIWLIWLAVAVRVLDMQGHSVRRFLCFGSGV